MPPSGTGTRTSTIASTLVWLASLLIFSPLQSLEAAAADASDASTPIFWCDSTDTNKLDLLVTAEGNRYFMTNVAKYAPADKNRYYFVNWDLQGTHRAGRPIEHIEVEPNTLYLVHLYELNKPKILTDFWANDPSKQACSAVVWVGAAGSM
jgi:hypothetical protein